MKPLKKFTIIFLTMLALTVFAHAQSPREQLQQLTIQLQQNPSDHALREKIIKLAQTLKPAPVVPEEAQRRMVRGAAAFKGAKNQNDYQDAVREFEQASLAAPWSSDIYYNIGLAQDKTGDHASAIRSLKLALLASPNSKETKNLLYEVEYRLEKVNSPEAQAAKKREQEEALLRTLDGAVFERKVMIPGGHLILWNTIKIQGRQLIAKSWQTIDGNPFDEDTKSCVLAGLRCEVERPPQYMVRKISYEILANGSRAIISHQMPDGAIQQQHELQRIQ